MMEKSLSLFLSSCCWDVKQPTNKQTLSSSQYWIEMLTYLLMTKKVLLPCYDHSHKMETTVSGCDMKFAIFYGK